MRDKYAHSARAVRSYNARKASSSISNTVSAAAASARSRSISEIVTSRMIDRNRIQQSKLSRQAIGGDGGHDEAAAKRQRDDADHHEELRGLVGNGRAHVKQ